MMLASTLMFKVLSGAASDKLRYEMLHKIGAQARVLKASLRKEIGVLFLAPALLGAIDVLLVSSSLSCCCQTHTARSGFPL